MRLRQKSAGGQKPDTREFFIIEVNPNPYLEKKAEFAKAARTHGLTHPELLERIVEPARTGDNPVAIMQPV